MSWGPKEYVEAYVEGGASIDDIALMAGKSYTTIRYHLLKQGVKLRSRSEHLPVALTPESEKCHEGHDMKEYGHTDTNMYTYCKLCKNNNLRDKYNNDPEFREARKRRSREWKQRQKDVSSN